MTKTYIEHIFDDPSPPTLFSIKFPLDNRNVVEVFPPSLTEKDKIELSKVRVEQGYSMFVSLEKYNELLQLYRETLSTI